MKPQPKHPTQEPGLSLADVQQLTAASTADLFAAKMKQIRRAFVENGKLVYHLDTMKLRAGQSVYGLLKSRGVSEGSIHSARTVANLITALVIPGHVPEDKFDATVTFRTARLGDLLLKGKGKDGFKMEAEALAAVFLSGAAVGEELECLHEHGQTIAEREASIKATEAEATAKAEAAAAAEKELAARRKADEKADALAAKENAKANSAPQASDEDEDEDEDEADEEESDADEQEDDTDADEEESDEEEEESDADEDEDEADEDEDEADEQEEEEEEESEAPTAGKVIPIKDAAPAPVTLAGVIGEFNAVLNTALDLNAADMTKLVSYLEGAVADLAATIPEMEKVG
jgi:flagellar biosynthesis GTPase FlhF